MSAGDLTDHDYLVAWSRRLVELVDVAEPDDEYEAELQAARRVAVALLAGRETPESRGQPWVLRTKPLSMRYRVAGHRICT